MLIAILVFDGLTPLDAIGPFEVLGRLPGAEVRFVGKGRGTCRTTGRSMGIVADYDLNDVRQADILLVPGGPGADALALDPAVTEWVAAVHKTTTWTVSVCSGALILGGAGILKGLRATTHWRAMDSLSRFGATAVRQRMVVEGKVVTAAGVSAGIDMALGLAARIGGRDIAEAIQLAIEYAPSPPFDAGDYDKAPGSRVVMASSGLNRP